ncbi:uncharacterized protein BP01DRAFT_204404 [Aspergillus saccharolyticus JOP 1030-1]|uniref:Uncharacterized protein n=1 Tax=Aspergillus saccharolyticus JOP 1030-1 TaxID=1450539 RepID=A0A318Z065_9EURO|nr:hypothetical protein BP01DRAFT_204404 [Aspergillus saccharolyticus JOP 1030-1]PYH40671.1 hypothetical protein BP01DRAFT_204404 [Aspergillus saccharolyticus JOP 1030-1]
MSFDCCVPCIGLAVVLSPDFYFLSFCYVVNPASSINSGSKPIFYLYGKSYIDM